MRRAVTRGELDDDVDPNLIIETVVGAFYVRLLMTGESVDSDVVDEVASMVYRGLVRRTTHQS